MEIKKDRAGNLFRIELDELVGEDATENPSTVADLWTTLEAAKEQWRNSVPGRWLTGKEDGFDFWWGVEPTGWYFAVSIYDAEVAERFRERFTVED